MTGVRQARAWRRGLFSRTWVTTTPDNWRNIYRRCRKCPIERKGTSRVPRTFDAKDAKETRHNRFF